LCEYYFADAIGSQLRCFVE